MMTSLSERIYGVSSDGGQYEEFSRHSGRSNRAASLALPKYSLIDLLDKEQNVFDTLNLTPPPASNGRRHSSHYFPGSERSVTPPPPKKQAPPQPLPLVPPPVPKRTFQGKYRQRSRDSTINYSNSSYEHQSVAMDNSNRSYSQYRNEKNKYYEKTRGPRSLEFPFSRYTDISPSKLQHYGLSTSFDDIGDSDDLVLYDKKAPYVDSNKSSSDSNRSQVTIDTGYVSAAESMSAYTTNNSAPRSFRGRFSSEDTQCSMDSFTSNELQRTDTTDSISNTNYNDSPFSVNPKKNVFTFDRRFYPKSESEAESPIGPITPRRLPAIPARKPLSKSIKSRTMPPTPPNRPTETTKVQFHIEPKSEEPPLEPKKVRQIAQIIHQDSTISTDSFSISSSPGYSSKSTMEAPLLQHGAKMSKTPAPASDVDNLGPMIKLEGCGMKRKKGAIPPKMNLRQDSGISTDSFDQAASPSFTCKQQMDTPLLAISAIKMHNVKQTFKNIEDIEVDIVEDCASKENPITKSVSTPASLQTIVRLSNGSNMSLQHKILKADKDSNPYVTKGKLKFRLCQILLNAIALLLITGGLAAYFNAYPTVKFINQTVIITREIPVPQTPLLTNELPQSNTNVSNINDDPRHGVCLPIIVKFCRTNAIPYNQTKFPNIIGHFSQSDAEAAIEIFDALVDVQCSELIPLFLCSIFVPKCGLKAQTVFPCRSFCNDTMHRCGFFFGVFGLELPEYLKCSRFNESDDPEDCIGKAELEQMKNTTRTPECSGFLCDVRRCIPKDWQCDGHVDCHDQSDESMCGTCGPTAILCGYSNGANKCMEQRHVCDGTADCPGGQDERNCVRLSERNGDMGRGRVEVYRADQKAWIPACINDMKDGIPYRVCNQLGYRSVNSSEVLGRHSNKPVNITTTDFTVAMRNSQRNSFLKNSGWLRRVQTCPGKENYPTLQLTCTNYECGRVHTKKKVSTRIIGGKQSNPGDWPFLAAILGGPEEVFYCAGVLIADQWVLTAAHCIGNHTLRDSKDWTIQLGITRRHSHSYYGQKVSVKMAIPHPQYDAYIAHDNDIALFQLASRVAFHEHLLPVCLPPDDLPELAPNTECTVIGWGKREERNSAATPTATNTYEASVNEVIVPVLPRDLCIQWLEMLNVTEGMICAGYETGGKDACQGDSGGPLLCPYPNDKDRWFVGGIVSWGIMCAHPKLPGVYSNVPKYVPWIREQIQKYSTDYVANLG